MTLTRRHKFAYLTRQKNSFARFATETTIFVYLAGVVHTVAKHFISQLGENDFRNVQK